MIPASSLGLSEPSNDGRIQVCEGEESSDNLWGQELRYHEYLKIGDMIWLEKVEIDDLMNI